MQRLNIGDRVQCGRGTAEAVLGEIVDICEAALGVVAVVRDDDGRRHIVQVGRLAKVNDCLAWGDWPTGLHVPDGMPALRLVDGIPIHEPEAGLLDEEILPLFLDWEAGPRP